MNNWMTGDIKFGNGRLNDVFNAVMGPLHENFYYSKKSLEEEITSTETDEYVEYEMCFPGFDRKDIKIKAKCVYFNTNVNISGKNDDYEDDFSFKIPFKTEKITSKLKNGILKIKAFKVQQPEYVVDIDVE